jgi:hypothetical protein
MSPFKKLAKVELRIANSVIARSSCDDCVRRSSKSEGGSNPVFLLWLLDCFASLATTGLVSPI